MKKSVLLKDTLREIKKTSKRYFSIILIISIGVGFFAGIKSTAPTMKATAQSYYDTYNLMDLQIMSTAGFSDEDAEAITNLAGVKAAVPAYQLDVVVGDSENSYVLRLMSAAADSTDEMNGVELYEGRMPQAPGECVAVDRNISGGEYHIGDVINVNPSAGETDVTEVLNTLEYTVVGIGRSSMYFSYSYGTTTIGNGSVQSYAIILDENFNYPRYTIMYVDLEDGTDVSSFDEQYKELITSKSDELTDLGKVQYDSYVSEVRQQVEDAQSQLEEGEEESQSELVKAYKQLQSAKEQLDDAKIQLDEGWTEYNTSKADAEKELAAARQKLDDAWAVIKENRTTLEEGWAEYNASIDEIKAQFADAWAQIQEGYDSLAESRTELDAGWAEYNKQYKEFLSTAGEYYDGQTTLADAKEQLDKAQSDYDAGLAEYTSGLETYNTNLQEYEDGLKSYDEGVKALEDAKKKLEDGEKQYKEGTAAYEQGVKDYADGQKTIEEKSAELYAGKAKLESAEAELSSYQQQYEAGLEEYNAGKAQLDSSKEQLDAAKAQLDSSKAQLDAGEAEYTAGQQKIDDAKKQCEEGEAKLTAYDNGAAAASRLSNSPNQSDVDILKGAINTLAKDSDQYSSVQTQLTIADMMYRVSGGTNVSGYLSLWSTIASNVDVEASRKQLADAYAEIDAGEAQLKESRAQLDAGWKEYNAGVDQYNAGLKEYESGLASLNEAQATLNSSKAELDSYQAQLTASRNEIAAGERSLAEGKEQLADAKKQLEESKKKLADSKTEIADGKVQIADNEKLLAESKIKLEEAAPQLKEAAAKLADAKKQLEDAKTQIDANTALYEDGLATLISSSPEIKAAEEQFEEAKAKLDDAEAQYNAGKAELEQGEAEYNDQLAGATSQLDDAKAQLDEGQAALDEGEEEANAGEETYSQSKSEADDKLAEAYTTLEQSQTDYENGVAEYDDGLAQYYESVIETENKLTDARSSIQNAAITLNEIEAGKWYVFTRDDTVVNYSSLETDANNIDTISTVFPVFFLAVAALVCLTTITRMIDEERTQMGIYKALGYSTGDILFKYIFYAASAAVVGTVVGVTIGVLIIPWTILKAYEMMYDFSTFTIAVSPIVIIISFIAALACTVSVAVFCCMREIKVSTAALMRPKVPKAGAHILLERVTPIWSKLNFSVKNSLRNIFRHKVRMMMTIIGVFGCMALMIAGFGLGDAMETVSSKQYGVLTKYDFMASFLTPYSEEDAASITDEISADSRVEKVGLFYSNTVDAVNENGDVVYSGITLTVPRDAAGFDQFTLLRDADNGNEYTLGDDGVVVSMKLASKLKVKAGDTVTFRLSDQVYTVTVAGVSEQYIFNNIYMSPSYFEKIFSSKPTYGSAYINVSELMTDENAFKSDMLGMSGNIVSVVPVSLISESIENAIENMNVIVVVMVVCAGGLAFIVLYNLTNINISERIREIATVSVLGFTNKEANAYIFRENIYMCALAIILGWPGGTILSSFIVSTLDIKVLVLINNIDLTSYIYATALTILFIIFVDISMSRVVKNIDMVESMKGVE